MPKIVATDLGSIAEPNPYMLGGTPEKGVQMVWVSIILASAVPIVLVVGYLNRRGNPNDEAKGIGWQFIRYTVLAIAVPVAAVLALNGELTGEATAIIAGAMGYAFGKGEPNS